MSLVLFVILLVFALYAQEGSAQIQSDTPRIPSESIQTMPLLKAPLTANLPKAIGGADSVITIEGDALVAQTGPRGTQADVFQSGSRDQITTYIVREGDTLGHIAEMFNLGANTIRWQNDLDKKSLIKPGQKLIILPEDGITVAVRKGDTLESLAKKYQGFVDEIERFNDVYSNQELKIGMQLVIPGGEPLVVTAPIKTMSTSTTKTTSSSSGATAKPSTKSSSGYYIDPMKGRGTLTQVFHGRWRAIDIGAPTGTPIYASAAGKVVIDNNSGWGGGYGNYVVLTHGNGAKTLSAHMTDNVVKLGQYVQQGELIGHVGSTGRSTGPHLHFEIRGDRDVPYKSWGR
ncbi:MAG: LysM repeat protein [Planctomycetota bacterium]